MYTNFQFETWLNKEYTNYTDDRYANGPYMDKILPQLKKGVISSLLACRDQIMTGSHQTGHEIFGYDFIIDKEFNTWLIEANTNPCLEESS